MGMFLKVLPSKALATLLALALGAFVSAAAMVWFDLAKCEISRKVEQAKVDSANGRLDKNAMDFEAKRNLDLAKRRIGELERKLANRPDPVCLLDDDILRELNKITAELNTGKPAD